MKNTTISGLIAGVMNWGIWGKNFTENQVIEMINGCLDNQITTFDHADIYGAYTTEEMFGNAFYNSGIDRENIQLITKCGIAHTEGRNNKIKHYNYSKEYIIWSVENSLKNLKTDYLDVLLLHRPSPLMEPETIAEAINVLKKEGKIIQFGVSNFSPMQTQLINKEIGVDYNQIQFSATHFEPMLNDSLSFMQNSNIIPMAWKPLGNVFKEKTQQTKRLIVLLKLLETKYEVTTDVILLAWILQHQAKIIPVLGTTNLNRIKNATKALQINLDLEDWFAIWETSMGHKVD